MWTPSFKKQRLKVVLDTNVWVSAIIWGGLPASIIRAAEDHRITIVVSAEILQEINSTLAYPRLRDVYEDLKIKREELIEAILRIAKLVEVKTKVNIIHEDLADNKFLECALDGDADYLVSGDEHVLRIEHYQKTRILSVRHFLRILEKSNSDSSDSQAGCENRIL